jgi:hypothetical protein
VENGKVQPPDVLGHSSFLSVFFDIQNTLGAGFDTDTAGYTFAGTGFALSMDHHLKGTGFHAFAAINAELLVQRVHALDILGYGPGFTDLGTLSALHAGDDFEFTGCIGPQNVDTGQILGLKIFIPVKSLGTGVLTGQTEHTGRQIFNS